MAIFKPRALIVSTPPQVSATPGETPRRSIVVAAETALAFGMGLGCVMQSAQPQPRPEVPPRPVVIPSETLPGVYAGAIVSGKPTPDPIIYPRIPTYSVVAEEQQPFPGAVISPRAPQYPAFTPIIPALIVTSEEPRPCPSPGVAIYTQPRIEATEQGIEREYLSNVIVSPEQPQPHPGSVVSLHGVVSSEVVRAELLNILIVSPESPQPFAGAVIVRGNKVAPPSAPPSAAYFQHSVTPAMPPAEMLTGRVVHQFGGNSLYYYVCQDAQPAAGTIMRSGPAIGTFDRSGPAAGSIIRSGAASGTIEVKPC